MARVSCLLRFLVLCCAGPLLLAGCTAIRPMDSPPAATEAAPAAATSRTATQAAESTTFSDLDPASACVTQPWILGNVYETLTRYNLPGAEPLVLPSLATEWSVSDDGLTWTFKLQEGVKFHDGSDFNAEAVIFTVERNKALNQCSAYIYSAVESMTTPDPYTVVFHLSEPATMDLILASVYNAWIKSPAVKEQDSGWFNAGNDAGTGPYRMAQYEPGQRMVLERFDGYWRGWEGDEFDRIIFESIGDMTAAEQMLRAGQLDFATNRILTPEQMTSLDAEDSLTLLSAAGYGSWYIYLNHQRPPTDNLLVRQALAYSFPYDDVIAATYQGQGTRSHGAVPVTVWGHNPSPSPYTFDLDKARELLIAAGYGDGLELTFAYDPGQDVHAELWQAALAEIGVTLNLERADWAIRWETQKSDPEHAPHAYILAWFPDVVGPYSYLFSMFHSEDLPVFNLGFYSSPEFDALIDEGNILTGINQEAAAEKFIAAEELLAEAAAALFIQDTPDLHVIAEDLQGYVNNPAYSRVVFWYEVRRSGP